MSPADNSAVVETTLYADIYWNTANALGEPILANLSEKHSFNLVKESNTWKIDMDIFGCTSGSSENVVKDNDIQSLTDKVQDLKEKSKLMFEKAKESKSTKMN